MEPTLHTFSGSPSTADVEALRALAASAASADGHPPFNDQTWAALRAGDHGVRGALVPAPSMAHGAGGEIGVSAAAVLTQLDDESGPGALVELVVDPAARGHGLGEELTAWALASVPADQAAELWSHGGHPAAARLAAAHGLEAVRELWVMSLEPSAVESLPEPSLPESVSLTRFRAGHDEAEWLRVNAAAFDFHPEQGKMTLGDLQAREAEDWFDPEGFFLAHGADGELLGFHWTKLTHAADGSVQEGEVYAVGIAPSAQGMGLGRALTIAGLKHLVAEGAPRIVLYVEADNHPAVKLYESLGFTVASSDVLYARRGSLA